MFSDKKLLGIVILAAASVWLLFQAVTPYFLNKTSLEQSLQKLAASAGAELKFSSSELKAFPSQSIVFKDAEFSAPAQGIAFKASRLRIGLTFPAYWRGITLPSMFKISGGDLSLTVPGFPGRLEASNFSAFLKNIGYSQTMRYEFRGDLEGSKNSLIIKGSARLPRAGGVNLQNMTVSGNAQLKDLAMKPFVKFAGPAAWEIESGSLNGTMKFGKKTGENFLTLDGKARGENFIYKTGDEEARFQSKGIEVDFVMNALWNFTTGEWVFKKTSAQFPFGQVEIRGSYFSREKTFKGFHVSLLDFSLDELSVYYPPLAGAIPFNFGFSGPSRAEISFEGAMDKLTLHVDWDMTGMLLSYARYFSKSKETPANFVFDLELADMQNLSGNFSLLLKDGVFKGALPKLDLASGNGELNIISNKFSLAGWEKILLPFEGSLLGGEMKILANYQGNILRKPEEVKTMLNLTLDNASVTRQDGWEIRNISMNLDFAPVSFEIRKFAFELGKSSVAGSLSILHPLKEPEVELKLNSPSVNFPELLDSAKKAAVQAGFSEAVRNRLDYAGQSVLFFLGPEDISNLVLDLNYRTGAWTVRDMQAQIIGGGIKIQGDFQEPTQIYKINLQADRLDLSRLGFQKPKPLLEGNLFLTFQGEGKAMDGEWQKALGGSGVFSVTAGAFSQVDLLGGMSVIPELKPLSQYASGQTRFDDLRSTFEVEEGKVMTSKVDLIGADVDAKADGSISLTDGAFNYRLDAFLSQVLSENLLESLGVPVPSDADKKQLGPIPFLLAGDFGNLRLTSDPKRVLQFQEDLQKKKSYKVFNSFLPEDLLLSRPSNS